MLESSMPLLIIFYYLSLYFLAGSLFLSGATKMLQVNKNLELENGNGLSIRRKIYQIAHSRLFPFVEIFMAVCVLHVQSIILGLICVGLALIVVGGIILERIFKTTTCKCFGSLTPKSARGLLVLRVLMLIAIAVVLAFSNYLSINEYAPPLVLFYVMLSLVALYLLRIVLDTISPANPRQDLNQKPATSEGKPQTLELERNTFLGTLDGREIHLQDIAISGKLLLLLYLSADCKHCEALLPDIGGFIRGFASEFPIVVLSDSGTIALSQPAVIAIDSEKQFFNKIQAQGSPFGLVVHGTTLKVVSPIAYGPNKVRALFSMVLNSRSAPS